MNYWQAILRLTSPITPKFHSVISDSSYSPSQSQTSNAPIYGIWSYLSRRRRIQLGFLLTVMLASGGAEMVSLAGALPFLAVLASPQKLWDNPLVQSLALGAGFVEPEQLLLPAALAFALAAVIAAAVRLLNLWLNNRLAAAIGSDISSDVYLRTLYQPYAVHVRSNSSTVVNTITNQVARVVVALNSFLSMTKYFHNLLRDSTLSIISIATFFLF